MTRKVLPSKSVSSEEHFQYLSYGHIFPRSKDIHKFTKKLHPVVSYIWVHHMLCTYLFFYNPLYGTKKKKKNSKQDPYFKKCTKTLIKFEKQFKNVLKS